jgi:alpha-methylacyl-CoA racemase
MAELHSRLFGASIRRQATGVAVRDKLLSFGAWYGSDMADGPLTGIRVLEFASIGPGPFVGMMLSDMGATVLRVERPGAPDPAPERFDARGRLTIELNLKEPHAIDVCLKLFERTDIVFEGNRPGVMERLGLGPDVVLTRNPRIVYGRMTGWGQSGPYAPYAGHDINYLSLSGALHAIGTEEKPIAPLNLAADYGGGAMFLVAGLLAGIIHSRASGKGQVIDAAMTDGAAYLMTYFHGMHAAGSWVDRRRANLLDGGAPFYDTYRCADGKWLSVGALEPKFYALLLEKTDSTQRLPQPQMDQTSWADMRQTLREVFATRTRQEWCDLLEHTDACFAPVLSLAEAPAHPHNRARGTFVEVAGVVQPAPAPRFSATPSRIQWPPAPIVRDTRQALKNWGIDEKALDEILGTIAGEGR